MFAPLLFMVMPVALAGVVAGVQRWRNVAVGLAVSVTLLLAVLAVQLPLDVPLFGGLTVHGAWTILGRSFIIEPVDRLGLALIFAQAALLFFVARLARTNRLFLPVALLILGLLAAALFVQPLVFAALFVELASALAVFLLADERHPVTRGALRYFAFMTFGMACVLITGWLLEAIHTSPDDAALTFQATLMLGVGFAVFLGVAPFHNWMPVVAEHSPALSATFVFTVLRFPVALLLLQFLNVYPWLNQNPTVYRAFTLAGGGMALLGAGFAFGQKQLGRALGYAMLVDVGAFLLAVGLGTVEGLQAALATLVWRGLALTLWAPAMEQLRGAAGGAEIAAQSRVDRMQGLARRRPFAVAAALMGLLSLVGFPLTAGFPARWALLNLLAHIHPTAAFFLLLGMTSVALAAARALAAFLTPVETETPAEQVPLLRRLLAEPPFIIAVLGAGLALSLLLGAFPQLLLPAVANTAHFFTP